MGIRRRHVLSAIVAVAVLIGTVYGVAHMPGVQKRVWDRVARSIEEETGWRIQVHELALRALPARLVVTGVAVSSQEGELVAIDRVEARWRWRALRGLPHLLDSLVVEGVEIDLAALPKREQERSEVQTGLDLWHSFEIGEITLRGGRIRSSLMEFEGSMEDVAVTGALEAGAAAATLTSRKLVVVRDGRPLEFQALSVRAGANADRIDVQEFALDGGVISIKAFGSLAMAAEGPSKLELGLDADLAAVANWWDPNLATGLAPGGRIEARGFAELTPSAGLEIELVHEGAPLELAGYELEELGVAFRGGTPSLWSSAQSWGRVSVDLVGPATASIAAVFVEAPVDRFLSFLVPIAAAEIRAPASLSGTVDGKVSFPVSPETLVGKVDLALTWPEGRVAIRGDGAGSGWQISQLSARLHGVDLEARGRIELGGEIEADVRLSVPRPSETMTAAARWFPAADQLELSGGPVGATVSFHGSLAHPVVAGRLDWSEAVVAGRHFDHCTLEVTGDIDTLDFVAQLQIDPHALVTAEGTAQPLVGAAAGKWRVDVAEIVGMASMMAPEFSQPIQGRVMGVGTFAVSGGDYRVAGSLEAGGIGFGEWTVDRLATEFEAEGGVLRLQELDVRTLGGAIAGSLVVPFEDVDQFFRVDLEWSDLEIGLLPLDLPESVRGRVSGEAGFGGRVSHPVGVAEVNWFPDAHELPVGAMNVHAALADGELRVVSEEIETAGGAINADVVLPLGDLPRPDWLWPGAPGGPLRAKADAIDFHLQPVLRALGKDEFDLDVSGDFRVAATWSPGQPQAPGILLEVHTLRIHLPAGELVAEGPLQASFDGERLELAPLVLVGLDSRIEASAFYDPVTELVAAHLEGELSPGLTGAIPLPIRTEGKLMVSADLSAPASAAPSLESIQGRFSLDHRRGTMIMRDPPIEVRGLQLDASVDDGVVQIQSGSAAVNGGRVEFGGGWDPRSRQGIVFELENVTTLTDGILTRWNGSVAVEPRPDRLAHVVGDLELVAGLWDERVDISSLVLSDPADVAVDDPLHDISLDIAVRGRAGVRVDNNLGDFDVNWDVLHISGTAAVPVPRGQIRIAPGGLLSFAGQEVTVRRGSLEFTGDPAIDPIIEIVPENDTTFALGEGENKLDPAALATEGLARGISGVLGFENETLQPAEIAVQTEKDPSERFMVGQRVNRNLALFVATNLTDVQDRMTMLQLWNMPGLGGLALQAYQETSDDSLGFNAFQRFRWGGTITEDERPEIYRLRLDGEWPLSKRTLRKSTRLHRGQPFDPFLLFVASVRMERALAERGYQQARVTGAQKGSPSSPTLAFTCHPGARQLVEFVGDKPPESVRREVTSLYRAGPLESTSMQNMKDLVKTHLASRGFLKPEIVVERRGEEIFVEVSKGEMTALVGPRLNGVPVDVVRRVLALLDNPATLASIVEEPGRAMTVVERAMRNAGYLDAKVTGVTAAVTEEGPTEVSISVEAGPRKTVGSVSVNGNDPLGLTRQADFPVRVGVPLDRPTIDTAVRRVRDDYRTAGYRDAVAQFSIDQGERGEYRVGITIKSGVQRTVRGVQFKGRRDVSERVLRKGSTLAAGEVLTDAGIDRSASQIANFSPISRVDVRTVEVPGSQVEVEFDIVEKRRWRAEIGGGWSSERGFGAAFGLVDENLFGRGVGLNLRGSWDSIEQKLFLIGSLPPLPGGRLRFLSTVGYSEGDAPDDPDFLKQEQKLASLETSYRLFRGTDVGLYYRWTDTRTFEKDPSDFFPFDIRVNVGTLGLKAVVDRFDYPFDPRRGWGLTTDFGWSSQTIGSDLEYVRWLTGYSLALEPFENSTWVQSIRAGVSEPLKGMSLDRDAKFFAGGQGSVRGFDLNSVGPVTYGIGGTLVPGGGGALLVFNEELRIPVWNALRLAVFADIGQVWESWSEADARFSVGAGVGVRWSTPIGPLWADVAWPVANIGISSNKPKFYLGIGRPF